MAVASIDDPNKKDRKTRMQQLGVFAKYWEPGKVKTRLAATIGQERASRIYKAFAETLLARLSTVGQRRVLAITPADRLDEFLAISGQAWTIESQANGDLGARMRHYFDSAFANGAQSVVLLGSDSPDIPLSHITSAFQLLDEYPVVLGPSDDGGYYLIAARDETPPIFEEIAWSTPSVLEETIRRLDQVGVRHAQLPPWYDVDDADSLARIAHQLQASDTLDDPLINLRHRLLEEIQPR